MSHATRTATKLEYKVAALIAAVACAALVGKAYLEPAVPLAPPVAASKAADKLPTSGGPEEQVRSRAAAAIEFAAVYGLAADKPYTTLAAAEWSTPATRTAEATAAKPHRKTILAAQACAGECGLPSGSAAVVPPPRPANLTLTADASTGDDRRVRLLGLSLPGFVPSGERIAKTVVSWGGSIAGVIPGL